MRYKVAGDSFPILNVAETGNVNGRVGKGEPQIARRRFVWRACHLRAIPKADTR